MDRLAPAGTPIGIRDFFDWGQHVLRRRDGLEALRAGLVERFGVPHVFFVSSGRAAMTLLLQVLYELHGDPRRTQVIVPGYTCYSVPASARKAGLDVRICDIDPVTLSYDAEALERFDFGRVLAIVSANLYGIPNDLPAIARIADRHGVYLLDDAAQALGARIAGQYAGTFGDAGLYSLDKGKNITSLQGGILVTSSSRIAAALDDAIMRLPPPSPTETFGYVAKLAGYAALLPPRRYGITRALPFLGLGKTPYTTVYPVTRYSPLLGAFAAQLLNHLPRITHARVTNAKLIQGALRDVPGLRAIAPLPTAEPVFVRLPMLLDDPGARPSLLAALDRVGIGATASYPGAVADIPELQPHLQASDLSTPGARSVAERIITLPTHPYVMPRHIERMSDAVRQALSSMSSAVPHPGASMDSLQDG